MHANAFGWTKISVGNESGINARGYTEKSSDCGIQVERVEKRDKRDVDESGKFMEKLFLLFTAYHFAP